MRCLCKKARKVCNRIKCTGMRMSHVYSGTFFLFNTTIFKNYVTQICRLPLLKDTCLRNLFSFCIKRPLKRHSFRGLTAAFLMFMFLLNRTGMPYQTLSLSPDSGHQWKDRSWSPQSFQHHLFLRRQQGRILPDR